VNGAKNHNFISLKNHKKITINLIVNFFSFSSSITYKISLFKIWCKLKMFQESFCMFKTIVNNDFFFKCFFSLSNVHHSFSKLEMILILIIIKEKSFEIGKIHFKTHLNMVVSNVFFTLKIMIFEIVSLTKCYLFLCYLKCGCIIYNWYKPRYSKN